MELFYLFLGTFLIIMGFRLLFGPFFENPFSLDELEEQMRYRTRTMVVSSPLVIEEPPTPEIKKAETKPFDFYFIMNTFRIYGLPPCFSCKSCLACITEKENNDELELEYYFCAQTSDDEGHMYVFNAMNDMFEEEALYRCILGSTLDQTQFIGIKSPWDCPNYQPKKETPFDRRFYLDSGFNLLLESEEHHKQK